MNLIRSVPFLCWSAMFSHLLVPGVLAQCDLQPQIFESPGDSSDNYDDSDVLGGTGRIDKITRIGIYAGCTDIFCLQFVVRQICTTYRLTDGNTRELCHGDSGSTLQGTVVFGEGEYLRSVEMLTGRFIDNIRFRKTDGSWSSRFGGKLDQGSNNGLSRSGSVIKSFFGRSGDIPDSLRAKFESNRIYRVRQLDPTFTEKFTRVSNTTTPKAVETLNNLDGSIQRETVIEFKETVSTTETTTVTNSRQFDVEVSRSTSVGFNIKVVSAGVETSVTVGTSLTNTETSESSKTFTTEVSRTYTINAPPFTLVTAVVSWEQTEYEFDWQAPVRCSYTSDPSREVNGDSFQGTMAGVQAFPRGYVEFTEEEASGSPTLAPVMSPPTGPTTPTSITDPAVSGATDPSITLVSASLCFLVTLFISK